MYGTLATLAAFAFVYSVVASRLKRTPVGGPVVYMVFGILAGPQLLGLLDLSIGGEPRQGNGGPQETCCREAQQAGGPAPRLRA